MRYRALFLTVASACAVGLAAAPAASAAEGEFSFQYHDADGVLLETKVANPASYECHEVTDFATTVAGYAFTPVNRTGSAVVLFKDPNCAGAAYRLNAGSQATESLKFRSARFS
ncbi:hypothetical protein [Crossiella sp. NPDC003009]